MQCSQWITGYPTFGPHPGLANMPANAVPRQDLGIWMHITINWAHLQGVPQKTQSFPFPNIFSKQLK